MPNTAADRLVETLVANGVRHVFCVPGESYLSVLNALADHPEVKVITCRNENGAANMAVAYGKLTGKPGICMVTRGPGATHGSIGIHTAQQDSVPLIMFVGQISRMDKGREAFQELDYRAVFGSMTKLTAEIDEPTRTVEIVSKAFATALQGRHGPVLIALPEDVLDEPAGPRLPIPVVPARTAPDPVAVRDLTERLSRAQRPIVILGGTGWEEEALADLAAWLERGDIPVALSFRRKDLIDNNNRCYAGDIGIGPNPALVARIKAADLVVVIGARLSESASQAYTLFTPEETAEKMVHFFPGAEELNRVWPASISAVADNALAARAIARTDPGRRDPQWCASAHAEYEAFVKPLPAVGAVNLSEVLAHLNSVLPADAIICNGAGNYAAYLHRFYRHRQFHTLAAPISGAMGLGVPAAIAAKTAYPDREVVCVAGDGDFMMTSNELATAVQFDTPMVILVVDNSSYGTIRMHQEKAFPGRVVATELRNPDFVAYARAFGGFGVKVEKTEDFPAAYEAARASGLPAVIQLIVSVQDLVPGKKLDDLRGVGR